MPGTIDQNCPSCGGIHTFLFTGGDFFHSGKLYEYTCPVTNMTAKITFNQSNKVVQIKPKGAVIVREV